MSSASDDAIFYGGDDVPMMTPDGVEGFHLAPSVIMADSFEMTLLEPGKLSDNPSFLTTLKGVDPVSGGLVAVTVLMKPEMMIALIKCGRLKYSEIPIEFR